MKEIKITQIETKEFTIKANTEADLFYATQLVKRGDYIKHWSILRNNIITKDYEISIKQNTEFK